MTFANPVAFFVLLSVPLILFLHLFRVRRREVRVTTLRFWDATLREREASALSRQLRLNLLLVLQVLALVALTLALARPAVTFRVSGYPRAVLILDTSASMKATDVPGGRFAAAQAQALEAVAGMPPGKQAMVLEASSRPIVLVPFTGDRRALRRAIEGMQPGDGSGRLEEAVAMALELGRTGPPAEIHLFSDAAFAPLQIPENGAPPLRWHVVGRRSDNVGITALEVRKSLYGAFEHQAFLALGNFATEPKSFALRLLLDGTPLAEQRVDLPPQVKRSFEIPFTLRGGGILRAEIGLQDDLQTDNHAHAVLPEPHALRVLLVTRGNFFLERALRVDPQVMLQVRTPEALLPESWKADVVVLDSYAPTTLPAGRYLLVQSLARNAPLRQVGNAEMPAILDWERDHPAMRYLDLSGVVVQRAMKVRPLGGGRAVVESSLTPLVYTWDEEGVRAIFVGFDFSRSDLPVRAAFPLFVSNALRWLYPNRLEDLHLQLRPGEAITLDAGLQTPEAAILDPLGRRRPAELEAGQLVYSETRQAGIYTARAGPVSRRYAVNLLDEEESNLTPGRGSAASAETGAVEPTYQSRRELWMPLAAAALLALLTEAILYYRRMRETAPVLSLALRAAVLTLIGLGVLGIQVRLPSDALHLVFLLDASDSVAFDRKLQALESARNALRYRGPQDSVGLIAFGATPKVEAHPEKGDVLPEKLEILPDGRATNIASAIRLGLAVLPVEGARRLVLLTDGNENRGSAMEAANEAKAAGVEIYPMPVGGADQGEVLVEQMSVPQEVKRGEPFVIRIAAWSAREGAGRLFLYRDGNFVGSRSVRLRQGKNILSFQESLDAEGFHVYQARLEAAGDIVEENNRAVGVVAARGLPRVLYVEKDQEQGTHLADALRVQSIRVEQVALDGIPRGLAALSDYDALIMSNVSALRLTKAQMETIRSYVRDEGGGLLMLGGEESFGVGGYYRTPVEEALPVTMESRQKIEVPSLAIVLLIDRSGSMETAVGQATRLDLAKEASQLAVELLDERNDLGVIAFDTAWSWVVPIGPAKDKDGILREIASIKAGGGTEMFPALKEAYEALYDREALLKHIIILSDGESSDADFVGLVRRMARDRITLSSVAISSEAGLALMREVSRWGRGRYYYTEDAYSIPRIFALETQLASKASVIEQPFRPAIRHGYHEVLREIEWERVPPLGGYVATTPKRTAETLLVSHQQDPVLAVWRYGLGRAAAFTSDAKAKWGVLWLKWDMYGKLFSQLVRWILRSGGRGEVTIAVGAREGRAEIALEAADQRGEFINFLDAEAGVVFPDERRNVFPLVQTGPGRYHGAFPAEGQGAYLIGISQRRGERTVGSRVLSLVVPYSAEHRTLSVNDRLLQDLARRTGGAMLTDVPDSFRLNRRRGSSSVEAWPWALLLAIVALLADLAVRRLTTLTPGATTHTASRANINQLGQERQ